MIKHKVLLVEPSNNTYGEEALKKPLGGSETIFIFLVRYLSKREDIELEVFYKDSGNFKEFVLNKNYDLVIAYRNPAPLFQVQGKMNTVYLQDLPDPQSVMLLNTLFQIGKINKMIFLSHFQKQAYLQGMPAVDEGRHTLMFENGLDLSLFDSTIEKKNEFIYASAPNRGLDVLLSMWKKIHSQLPDYTLKIAGSVKMYNVDSNENTVNENREAMLSIGNELYSKELEGVRFLGGLTHGELIKEMESSKALLYPSTFQETCCHVLNCALHAGCVPVISSIGAIVEKIANTENGIIIPGNPVLEEFEEQYIKSVVDLITSDRINRMVEVNRGSYLAWGMERLIDRLITQLLKFNEYEGDHIKVIGIICSNRKENTKANFKNLIWHAPIDMMTNEYVGLPLDQARNAAASVAIYMKADWLLFMDDDIYVDKNFLTNMLAKSEGFDVVVANYPYKETDLIPTIRIKKIPENKAINCYDVSEQELNDRTKYQFITGGLGATLISTGLLKKIGRPQFRTQNISRIYNGKQTGEDSYFYQECAAVGAKIYVTNEIPIVHVDNTGTMFGKKEHIELIKPQVQIIEPSIGSKISLIRNSTIENLQDDKYIEDLIPKLGLHSGSNETALPKYLHKFTGRGLNIWQYPHQFAKYLQFLSKQDINSYLEIGTNHGGCFITTIEYLNKVQDKNIQAVGVDIFGISPNIKQYEIINKSVCVHQLDSASEEFKTLIENKVFDLCLIDGDHSYDGCKHDYELIKNKAKIIVFHDICDNSMGVKQLWDEIIAKNNNCVEFIEQYENISSNYMGIGVIKYDKSWG